MPEDIRGRRPPSGNTEEVPVVSATTRCETRRVRFADQPGNGTEDTPGRRGSGRQSIGASEMTSESDEYEMASRRPETRRLLWPIYDLQRRKKALTSASDIGPLTVIR